MMQEPCSQEPREPNSAPPSKLSRPCRGGGAACDIRGKGIKYNACKLCMPYTSRYQIDMPMCKLWDPVYQIKVSRHTYVHISIIVISLLGINLYERCRPRTMLATQLCTWPARLTGAYKTSLKCFDSLLISHSAKAQLSSIASNHGRRKPDNKEPSDWLGSAPRCRCQGSP